MRSTINRVIECWKGAGGAMAVKAKTKAKAKKKNNSHSRDNSATRKKSKPNRVQTLSNEETDIAPIRSPGRPRCGVAHQAVLDAAAELLETLDYQKVTIEKIAAHAGVGKPTIYRWWKTKADLILEAYREASLRRLPKLDLSDDALVDLETHLKRLFRVHRSRPVAQGFRALIAESQLDPQFREKFNERFLDLRRSYIHDIVENGIRLGQFRKESDKDLVVDMLLGAFWYRLLVSGRRPFNDAFAKDLVSLVRSHIVKARR